MVVGRRKPQPTPWIFCEDSEMQVTLQVQSGQETKTFTFDQHTTIENACALIRQEFHDTHESPILLQPKGESNPARLLKPEKTLQYYNLRNNDILEFKRRFRVTKICSLFGIKAMRTDQTQPVSEIITEIAERFDVDRKCVGVSLEGKRFPLLTSQTLYEQEVTDNTTLVLGVWWRDARDLGDNRMSLHLAWHQLTADIQDGNLLCSLEEAVDFAAFNAFSAYGPWSQEKDNNHFRQFLPVRYRNSDTETKVENAYKKLETRDMASLKISYIQQCTSMKTFGARVFQVKTRTRKKRTRVPALLSISPTDVVLFDETLEIKKEHKLMHVKRWAAAPSYFAIDFGNYEDDHMIVETTESDTISGWMKEVIDVVLQEQRQEKMEELKRNCILKMEPIWKWERFLWIAKLKEDSRDCVLSRLPVEIIREIASHLLCDCESHII